MKVRVPVPEGTLDPGGMRLRVAAESRLFRRMRRGQSMPGWGLRLCYLGPSAGLMLVLVGFGAIGLTGTPSLSAAAECPRPTPSPSWPFDRSSANGDNWTVDLSTEVSD